MTMTILFVGEQRSPKAVKLGVHWEDEALAAKPLFAALRVCGIDPAKCRFVNWFEDGAPVVREHVGTIVALGRKVQQALAAEGIACIPLIHPAARGSIRLRENYISHVANRLTNALV